MDDPTTVTKTPTEVRQGVVRWVLGLSLFGAIVALVLTFLFVRGV
jgi:high-affinity Fe2+/Pb2+ permease